MSSAQPATAVFDRTTVRRKKGDATRQLILDAAERLFALHGVAAVSLNEINSAAGQKNASALQYHFGSRDHLIQAIVDRHTPTMRQRREQSLAALAASASKARRPVAEAIVRPIAELLSGDWRDRAYLRIISDLATDPSCGVERILELVADTPEMEAGRLLLERASPLPVQLQHQRFWIAGRMVLHALSDQALPLERPDESTRDRELFIANLVDMFLGAFITPPSAQTLALLNGEAVPRRR